MRYLYSIIVLVLIGCGSHKHHPASDSDKVALQAKYDSYLELLKGQSDENGFIYVSTCDSLLFSTLANTDTIKITAAEVESGKWYRRPTNYPECYAAGESRSTISRDGLYGVIYYGVKHKDADILKRLWDYGSSHNWVMGDGGAEHSLYSPEHIALLAYTLNKVSGGKYNYTVKSLVLPDLFAQEGYKAHLQAVSMLILETLKATDVLDVQSENIQQDLAKNNDNNAFFQYMAGNESKAVKLLLDIFPDNRLPTSADWCSEWRWQRASDDTDLQPCDKGEIHSGGDFVFLARLILGGR